MQHLYRQNFALRCSSLIAVHEFIPNTPLQPADLWKTVDSTCSRKSSTVSPKEKNLAFSPITQLNCLCKLLLHSGDFIAKSTVKRKVTEQDQLQCINTLLFSSVKLHWKWVKKGKPQVVVLRWLLPEAAACEELCIYSCEKPQKIWLYTL